MGRLHRVGVFETNSSSTNTLVLGGKLEDYIIPEILEAVDCGAGRDFNHETVNEKFTCLLKACSTSEEVFGLCYKLYEIGVKEIILPRPNSYDPPYKDGTLYISTGEIYDSCDELMEIARDKEKLKAWLFNPESEIYGLDDNQFYN